MTYKKEIISDQAPSAIGPYSQGIQYKDLYFFSGQIPINPKTNQIESNDIVSQTHQVFQNIKSLLHHEGLDFKNILKTTVFIMNMNDFSVINEIYASYFEKPYPARSVVEVKQLPKNSLIEIEIIACKED